ncbi:phage head-tail adapter protein [Pelotomaculum propionicicum]|uniref:phage head-tail adapter protein n=1 Tax=Pelotomaculum propionicicum TaxID=258475 RepID=UPI003B819361
MRHKEVIHLISSAISADSIGNQIETDTERKVFANEYSVGTSEYYNAASSGLRPAKMFEIYTFEYRDEAKLRHNSTTYRVIRSQGRGEKTILTCERVAADG